jgi:hypothetical protein
MPVRARELRHEYYISRLLRHFDSPLGRQDRLTYAAGLMVPEDREQQNDRQRYAQQPQQCASSKAHASLLQWSVPRFQRVRPAHSSSPGTVFEAVV